MKSPRPRATLAAVPPETYAVFVMTDRGIDVHQNVKQWEAGTHWVRIENGEGVIQLWPRERVHHLSVEIELKH